MKIKFILFNIAIIFVISACGLKDIAQPLTGGETINKPDYILYKPNKKANILVYVISPGGSKKSAASYINAWKPTADKNNFLLASPIDWNHEKILDTILEIKKENNIKKIFITGLSNGGYNACYFSLDNLDLIDGIIPMGAFCKATGIKEKVNKKIPVLIVVGEKDTWARGDDFKMIDEENAQLNKVGIYPEVIIEPGLGHAFPANSLSQVAEWINKN